MSVIMILSYLAVLLTALPIGYFLAWLTREELVPGKKWFKLIIYGAAVIGIVGLFVYRDISALMSLGYLILITGVGLWKSGDKKFVR